VHVRARRLSAVGRAGGVPGRAAWSELNNHPAMKALRPLWEVYTVPPPGDCSPFAEEEEERQRAFEEALAEREAKAQP
jgi:hypothetical protein